MAPTSKQANRKAGKAKQEDDEHPSAAAASSGDLLSNVKSLFLGSCIALTAPKLQALLTDAEVAPAKEPEKKEEKEGDDKENESKENEAETKEEAPKDAKGIFEGLCGQLTWCNVLGLAEPATGEKAMTAWLALKGLELDFGPKSKKKGNPAMDRIMKNLNNNMAQYLHLLLALMMLRAFLFRSWFACLPWLVGYQVGSLLLPLTNLPQLPQVPLDQVPTKFRVAGTMAIHALVWLFFLFEVVWKTNFLEKIVVVGLFAYHAYAVVPAE